MERVEGGVQFMFERKKKGRSEEKEGGVTNL